MTFAVTSSFLLDKRCAECSPLSTDVQNAHHFQQMCRMLTTFNICAECSPLSTDVQNAHRFQQMCRMLTTFNRCAECSPLSTDVYQTLMWWNHSETGRRLIASSWRQFYSFHKFHHHVIEFCTYFDKCCSILLDIINTTNDRSNTIYCDDCIEWMATVRPLSLRTQRNMSTHTWNSPVTVWHKILEILTQSECFLVGPYMPLEATHTCLY